MRQRLLFEGELSDVTLENVLPTLISKAVETDDDVFLRWNSATIRVEPTDTIDTLMQKYDKEIRLVGLANKMEMPADDADQPLTEQAAYDYYQERSVKAGECADQLAWMFIVMMTGGLISGHAFQAFSVCASLAAVYMLLSVAQAVWQTFTSWLFKQQIKKMDVAPDDYPSWVGGGAWLFFWAKMITITSAVIYFVKAIFF